MVAAPAALSLLLVISAAAHGRPAPRTAAPARAAAARQGSSLDRARAALAQVKRDPAKRRYRHHWERAIAGLERAARGRDAGPALLEAARARYALYRYSQVEADREAALRLAGRARKAGAREAGAFAAAVKREMGEEEPAAAPAPKPRKARVATVAAAPLPGALPGAAGRGSEKVATASATTSTSTSTAGVGAAVEKDDEEPSTDPVLEEALRGAPPEAGRVTGPARVSEVKSWSNGEYTRVAVYLSRQVAFTREEIPADGALPRRLALDLQPALLSHGLAHPVGDALVQRVRAAQRGEDTVRVVLDLAGRDDLAIFPLDDPPRLIVDVGVREARREAQGSARRGEAAPEAAEAAPDEREPRPAPAAREHLAGRGVRRIVVDAGHGGHDTGAIGPSGVREKDVTLAMARRLARQLRAHGFEVVLTRDGDRFVALEERTAIANARRGDLFVSIHANAHPQRDRRGLETYVLDVADDRYARRLAARENGALDDGAEEGQEVRRILTDLDARSSAAASRTLAETVQREVCSGVRARVGEVRDLGVKSALFHVLVGARMPAVLVETSFISNRIEERRLASARFQDEVAAGVTRAVERFAARGARVASAR